MTDAGRIAVTGAGGYLGGRLVADLAASGTPPRALVRSRLPWLGTPDQHVVDLLEPVDVVATALDGCAAVVHLAGHNEVVAARDPDRALAETLVATRHLADASTAVGIRRIVFVSTVHVYGDALRPGARIDEAVAPAPRGVYAIARLAAEHLVASGPDPVVLRLTNAVGAPAHVDVDRWTLVAAELCRSAVETNELVLRSTGQQWRDFIGLADVVRAITSCADPTAVPAGTYNLASGRSTTVRDLAELVQDRVEAITARRPTLKAPDRDGPDPEAYCIDPSRLGELGFRSEQPLADAVDEIIELCLAAERAGADGP
jgi:UDP-glucose 4-epimerase